MDTFAALASGFGVALQPGNLLWGLIGVTLGTAVGVLPGVGPALTVAMLLPLTVKLEPTGALIMFAGIYYGAMYGGSTTTILLNTPRSPPRSRATGWRARAAPARRSRPRRSARSWPARSRRCCSRCSRPGSSSSR
jgi:TctA family transporter